MVNATKMQTTWLFWSSQLNVVFIRYYIPQLEKKTLILTDCTTVSVPWVLKAEQKSAFIRVWIAKIQQTWTGEALHACVALCHTGVLLDFNSKFDPVHDQQTSQEPGFNLHPDPSCPSLKLFFKYLTPQYHTYIHILHFTQLLGKSHP